MTDADEDFLKQWLFSTWKEHRSPKFFLAGAVIGKADDIYSLAKKYGIKEKTVSNFCRRFDVHSPISECDRLVVVRSIFRSLDKWYCSTGKFGKDFPMDIFNILRKAVNEFVDFGIFVLYSEEIKEKPQYKFTDEVFVPRVEESNSLSFEKKIEKAHNDYMNSMSGWERDLFVNLVSHSESARHYEKMLRELYHNKALGLSCELKPKRVAEVLIRSKHDTENFFSDNIKSAQTPDEIFWVWVNLKHMIIFLDEIIDCVFDISICDDCLFWLKLWGLETFFEFVVSWKDFRLAELTKIETKAEIYGVDLNQMFEDALDAEFKIFAESA